MIRKFLSHRRKGALAMVAVAGMVPVTAMMSANLNTSQMIDDRRQMQDSADALAKVHGMWTARALNIISMNNVTTTQLLSVAVGSEALLLTTTEIEATAVLATGHITKHGVEHCKPRTKGAAALIEAVIWSAPCTAWHTAVTVPAALAVTRAEDIKKDFNPRHGLETAKKALKAIDGMNKALAARHPRAMAEHAKSYYSVLELDDHHFADPCNGPDLGRRCDKTNTGDGMALPIEKSNPTTRLQLFGFMERGVTSTFRARGFGAFQGPLSHGGSKKRPHLRDYINHVTEIGTALYDFKRFYDGRLAHLPRHPFAGAGNAIGSGYQRPGEPPDEDTPFDDDTKDLLDSLEEIMENADDITQSVLRVLRNLPLAYDRHPKWANLQGRQSIRGPNSFTRNFRIMHMMVLAPSGREYFPVSLLPFLTAAPVPETYQLKDINPLNPLPPVEPITMPDAYRILAYSLKDKSKRLGETVMSSPVDTHTGYGQAGVFNPDGASLFTQNWHTRLMPATRLDDPREAGRDLGRQARATFDDLADDLGQVGSLSSWDRVHAH